MPDLGTTANFGPFVDKSGIMYEIGPLCLFRLIRGRLESNSSVDERTLASIQNAQDSETFSAVAHWRTPRFYTIKKVSAFLPQRLQVVQRDDFAIGLHCGRDSILPFDS